MTWQNEIWFAFDTVNTISIPGDDRGPLSEIRALSRLYEQRLSRFRDDSDIWKINNAGGQTVEPDKCTAELLELAIWYGEKTGGAFDISIGTVNPLWDFKTTQPQLPEEAALMRLAEKVDYRKISLDGGRVRLPAGMQLDLGGIAKGYIADRLAEHLCAQGVRSGIINLGGNVLVIGQRPGGGAWRVGIQDTQGHRGETSAVVLVEDCSVVTSGIYERGFDWQGKRFHHVLTPENGWPADNELASVTIVARRSVDADALSTACLCLGLARSLQLLARFPDCAGLFIRRDGQRIWTGRPNQLL